MNQKVIWVVLALLLFTGGVVYMVSFFGGEGISVTIDPSGVDGRTREKYTESNNADIYYTDPGEPQASDTNNLPINPNVSVDTAPPGLYDTYDSSRVTGAPGRIVLFFHSMGCTSCENLEKDLLQNRWKIPTNLTILDVDFENGTEFKEKYGVTYNHTLVEIDKDGNLIKKWTGSGNLAELVKDLN